MLEKFFIQWPLLVLYVLASPIMGLWWLITHPVFFKLFRLVLLIGGGWVFYDLLNSQRVFVAVSNFFRLDSDNAIPVMLISYLVLVWLLFSKKRAAAFTGLHRPFPAPPPPVQQLFAESKARAEAAEQAAAEESEPAAEEIIYAQSAPTVEQSIDDLPENLKDLMRKKEV